MVKCIKIQLYYADDEKLDFKAARETLWQLQRETRAAANRAAQMCWELNGFESDWKKKNGEYPTVDERKELLGKSMQGLIYDRAKEDAPSVNTANMGTTLQAAIGRFNVMRNDIMRGNVSVPSYKKDIPLALHKKSIKLICEKDENGAVNGWYFELSMLTNSKKKELGLKRGTMLFKAVVPARSKKYLQPILERCYDGVYEICGSQLKLDAGRVYLHLSFAFDKSADMPKLDKEKIMGVHIAEANAVTCVFSESNRVLKIDGGEIEAFSAQIEKRRRSIGNASRKHSELCGDGRVGHGYHAKMAPLEHISTTVTNFRNTVNHRYSRQIVKWAVDNGCGTIQIEDLTGFATTELDKYKFMKSWSYYDLMRKIEAKAKEYGITVEKLPYKQLQKWCEHCNTLTVGTVTNENGAVVHICETCGTAYDLDSLIQKAVAVAHIADMLKNKDVDGADEMGTTDVA